MRDDAATTWVCSPHGNRVVQDEEPKGSCPDADRAYCVWSKVPERPAAIVHTGFGDCGCDDCNPPEPLTPLADHGKPLGLFRSLWVVLRGVRLYA